MSPKSRVSIKNKERKKNKREKDIKRVIKRVNTNE